MHAISNLHIVNLSQLDALSIRQYGGKVSNLASLLNAGVRIPPGVAIGKDVLTYFLKENGVDVSAIERIHNLGAVFLESAIQEAQDWQAKVLDVINKGVFPDELANAVFSLLKDVDNVRYAVRSSSVNEDGSLTSFAGQYTSVLNVHGRENLIKAIRACWISQYSGRALTYSISRRGMPVLIPSMAVLIQEMITPDFAGVCFTDGPTPKTKRFMIIESVPGVGEALVSGQVTPCHYELNKDGSIHRVVAPPQSTFRPPEHMISILATECNKIAAHFGSPQDIEWAIVGDRLFILQARPITVVGGKPNATAAIRLTSPVQTVISVDAPFITLRDDLHDWSISQIDPLIYRGASYLLLSQQNDGFWNLEFDPEWNIVATAIIINLLIDGGVPPALSWEIPTTNSNSTILGIPAAINWLIKNVNEDSTWGTDLWDTCQVLRAIIRSGFSIDEPLIAKAINFVAERIPHEFRSVSKQEWFGPGVFAVALHLFHEIGKTEKAEEFTNLLLQVQTPEGEYLGPHHFRDRAQVPSVWHTTQAVTALSKCTNRNANINDSIARACSWLISQQQDDGSWGVSTDPYRRYNTFFTSYAVIALNSAGSEYSENINRALKWLRGRQQISGSFGDTASSLMAMWAFQQTKGPVFAITLPLPLFLRIQATLGSHN